MNGVFRWYEDGTRLTIQQWKDGEEDGVFTHWHDDGVKDCEYQIEDGECISYTQWNRDGDIDEYNTNNKTIFLQNMKKKEKVGLLKNNQLPPVMTYL